MNNNSSGTSGLTITEALIGLVIVMLVLAIVIPELNEWYCSYRAGVVKTKLKAVHDAVQRCVPNHGKEPCFNLKAEEYVSRFEPSFRNKLTVENVRKSSEVKQITHSGDACEWNFTGQGSGRVIIYDTLSGEFRMTVDE